MDSHDAVGGGRSRLVSAEPPLGGADQRPTHALTVVHLEQWTACKIMQTHRHKAYETAQGKKKYVTPRHVPILVNRQNKLKRLLVARLRCNIYCLGRVKPESVVTAQQS